MEIAKWIVKKAIVVKDLDEKDPIQLGIIKMRQNRCNGCEHRTMEEDPKCSKCLCYIELKTKSLVNRNKLGQKEITHCPMGKWNDDLLINYLKKLI